MNKLEKLASYSIYLVAVLLFAVITYIYLSPVFVNTGFQSFDDAYMFIRYLKHFEAGHGMVWNIGSETVYGVTSTLYFILLLILSALTGMGDEQLLSAGSGLPALLTLLGLPFLCMKMYRILPERFTLKTEYALWFLLTVIYFVFCTSFPMQQRNGMETCLALLILLVFYLQLLKCLEAKTTGSLALLSILAYLSFSNRPETLVIVSLTPFLLFVFWLKSYRWAALYTVFLTALVVVDSLVKYIIFDDVLPLSYYAKQSSYLEGYMGYLLWHPFKSIFFYLLTLTPFVPFIVFGLFSRQRVQTLCLLIPVVLTLAYLLQMMLIMNVEGRYYLPLTIPFVFIALTCCENFFKQKNKTIAFYLAGTLVFFIVCFTVNQQRFYLVDRFVDRPTACPITKTYKAKHNYEHVTFLKNFLLVSSFVSSVSNDSNGKVLSIVMSEYGYIGAKHPEVVILDAVGLHDKQVAYNGFSADYMLSQKPDIVWFPHPHYTCINAEIINSERFWQEYDFFPGVFKFGFAIRKDSVFYQQAYTSADKIWRPYNNNSQLLDGIASPAKK